MNCPHALENRWVGELPEHSFMDASNRTENRHFIILVRSFKVNILTAGSHCKYFNFTGEKNIYMNDHFWVTILKPSIFESLISIVQKVFFGKKHGNQQLAVR